MLNWNLGSNATGNLGRNATNWKTWAAMPQLENLGRNATGNLGRNATPGSWAEMPHLELEQKCFSKPFSTPAEEEWTPCLLMALALTYTSPFIKRDHVTMISGQISRTCATNWILGQGRVELSTGYIRHRTNGTNWDAQKRVNYITRELRTLAASHRKARIE